MFYEASRFECRKMIFDATKVTYNMYSCAISGISRLHALEIYSRSSSCGGLGTN